MNVGQDSIALGAETISHEGLRVDDSSVKGINVPTLVICGRTDHPSFFEEAKTRFPNLKFKKIEGAGHGPAMQSPELLADIRQFLAHPASGTASIP